MSVFARLFAVSALVCVAQSVYAGEECCGKKKAPAAPPQVEPVQQPLPPSPAPVYPPSSPGVILPPTPVFVPPPPAVAYPALPAPLPYPGVGYGPQGYAPTVGYYGVGNSAPGHAHPHNHGSGYGHVHTVGHHHHGGVRRR